MKDGVYHGILLPGQKLPEVDSENCSVVGVAETQNIDEIYWWKKKFLIRIFCLLTNAAVIRWHFA